MEDKENINKTPSKMARLTWPKAKYGVYAAIIIIVIVNVLYYKDQLLSCLLYTSPSPRDGLLSRMPSSA